MNKLLGCLVIFTVVMSVVSGLLFYQLNALQNENSELKDELEHQIITATNRVKITDFRTNGTTFPVVGVGWQTNFVVTVENFGINDVENLTVVLNVQYYTSYPDEIHNHSIAIGTVKVGESKTVHKWVHHGYSESFFVATLMMNDIILDNRTTVLTW